MLHEAQLFMKLFPEEIIFWRDAPNSVAQYNRIGNNWQVLIEKGMKIKFHNLSKGGLIDIPYRIFKNLDELIDKDSNEGLVKPGMLNVVYFKDDYKWIDMLGHLRHTVGWQSVFIDEVEDIVPLNPSRREGEERNYRMEKNLQFSNDSKLIRKGLVNMLCNTQSYLEVDWRFRTKLTFLCYLRGSKVDSESRISQSVVDNLCMGETMIDMEHRRFGKVTFPGFPPRSPLFEPIIS